MILEDHQMNNNSIEAAAMPASAEVGIEPAVELNKPTSDVSQEAWYNIEYSRYVLGDSPVLLEKDSLTPLLAEDNHLSLGHRKTRRVYIIEIPWTHHRRLELTSCLGRCIEDSEYSCRGSVSELKMIRCRLSRCKRTCRQYILSNPSS